MPNIHIFHLSFHDKDFEAMQQPNSVLVPSQPDSQDSSPSSPLHQQIFEQEQHQDHQDQDQEQEQHQDHQDQEQDQEQEKLQDGSRRKRKWEYLGDDEASLVETPRDSNSRCYDCPPRPPRKPKADPAMKRRAMWVKRSVVFLDVATEVESMFPPSLLQDFGKKIKKAKS